MADLSDRLLVYSGDTFMAEGSWLIADLGDRLVADLGDRLVYDLGDGFMADLGDRLMADLGERLMGFHKTVFVNYIFFKQQI